MYSVSSRKVYNQLTIGVFLYYPVIVTSRYYRPAFLFLSSACILANIRQASRQDSSYRYRLVVTHDRGQRPEGTPGVN